MAEATIPGHVRLRWTEHADSPLQELRPQSILLLAALDPNIARLLSLYWVDRFGTPNGPEQRQPYDYKVVGHWAGRSLCGLAPAIGRETAPLPAVGLPASGEQLEGIRWQGQNPVGRVRLSWTVPVPAHPKAQVTRPIFYDIERINETLGLAPQLLTEKQPILAPNQANKGGDVVHYLDPRAPIGRYDVLVSGELALFEYRYQVRGIDRIGQTVKNVFKHVLEGAK